MAGPKLYKLNPVPGTWGRFSAEPRTPEEIEKQAQELLDQLSLDEKLDQLAGDTPLLGALEMVRHYNQWPIPAGENHRLGIPGIRFSDGPRGVVMYSSTCFPVSMARGASWDVELEERIGDAIGVEARAQGANFYGGVCINLLRHPAWGRAQETYGEEPQLLGEMGAALVRGSQRHIMACAKHYATNSMENARFRVDVQISERTLREVYLPHFRRCVREGVASIMSAYNKVNGKYCGHNPHLLRDILKEDWGFQGFVMTDFMFGIYGPKAVEAGVDVEMPHAIHFGRKLKRRVERGEISEAVIDEAVRRILRQKLRFASRGESPERYRPEVVVCEKHRALAREAAQKSVVLLQNRVLDETARPLLPLDATQLSSLAVIGRLATAPNLGDFGSSRVRPPSHVTLLEGLRSAAGSDFQVEHDFGKRIDRAVQLAARADVAVVVAGLSHRDEGEYIVFRGGDRDSLRLHEHDEALIQAVAQANSRCVVVLIGGSAFVTETWRDEVPALLMAWYPGMEGGHAVADLLLGHANPSGKLPCVFPKSSEQLPFFDKKADRIEYGYFHGQRLLDHTDQQAAFPLGFGLSYTRFAYANLELEASSLSQDGTLRARVDVSNAGERAGDEVIQLYVGYPESRVERPVRELKAFARVSLAPGETRRVELVVPISELAYYDESRRDWVVEPVTHSVWVGPSSEPRRLTSQEFVVR